MYPALEGVDPGKIRFNPDYPDGLHVFAQLKDAAYSISTDPAHELDDVMQQIEGGCMGFVTDFARHNPMAPATDCYQIMAYFTLDTLPVLHTLARNSRQMAGTYSDQSQAVAERVLHFLKSV